MSVCKYKFSELTSTSKRANSNSVTPCVSQSLPPLSYQILLFYRLLVDLYKGSYTTAFPFSFFYPTLNSYLKTFDLNAPVKSKHTKP